MNNRNSSIYKFYPKEGVGPGALANDEVTHCDVCTELGYSHESVVVQTLPNNTIRILNYNDGTGHIHKQVVDLDDPDVWEELWKK